MTKKSKNELLQKKIFLDKKTSWHDLNQKEVFKFAEGYKNFMKESKTERLCVENILKVLKKAGFKDISQAKEAKTGDKLYKSVRGKAVFAAIVGKNKEQWQLIGSHVDSPRLDLKPHPVYEDSGFGLMKTHYYGGVKKYHWVNTPLALHGVAFTKAGKQIKISIGDKENEPKFIIPDLLPHLAKNQMERKANKIVEGEELNILVGHLPVKDEKIKEQVKFTVLKYLNEKYGLIEEDFAIAELELVPASNPMDIGFDSALIAAYGQDDKVCVYTSLMALLETKTPNNTAIGMFVDKEEIGSMGDTGAASFVLQNFAYDYVSTCGLKLDVSRLFENSNAVSADVTAGMNPNYKDVHDPSNASYLGKGVSVEKYGGGGGKYSTHDAHAEYMQYIRGLLDKNKISWQTGELGKIDLGGGGTIAMFLSRYGMNCLDAGPSILGMHSPCEVTSKADVYSAYLFYKAFFKN
ncbi:aminopeptidase [Candidatus Woesearchaeota archaeon]|jgi:aspartyl aminopeptidase|nr:aminopeptidase [Candidatus Woesearchaeota archaeon]MBT4110975.1 aminopeptidase [Candidatus Woesearchaeota archaeon]MBT4336844.1 aminopeptidase [Candidatus Woesearchaeota archaeon]MBT4469841.1 aminopeptidase [Candidatus Woesearchaeota archaeon]MBT6743688.1 aminopeptidase [Candidatus Woesearchaeota archaeon]